MGRVLGIDYGKKRVGLAVSDPLGLIATGLDTLLVTSEKKLLKALLVIIDEKEVTTIVMGLPKKTTGELGEMAQIVQAFGETLASQSGIPVVYEDERFTSTIAQQAMHEAGISPSRNKAMVDQTAAVLILQQYMDKQARQ